VGSVAEGRKFFRSVAKPQDSFQDRALAPLMAGRGWKAVAAVYQAWLEANAFETSQGCATIAASSASDEV
jgi:hypothetical protein